MSRATFVGTLAAAWPWSCKRAPETKQYALTGEVVSIDAQSKTVKIKHEKLGDWMEAMTMDFPVKDVAELAKVQPGDKITATVFHQPEELNYWVAEMKVVGR